MNRTDRGFIWAIVLVLIALALAGIAFWPGYSSNEPGTNGNGTGSGGIVPFNSGVRGVLMAGPTCPVERDPPDPNCADRPLETIVAMYRASDTTRAHVVTRSNAQGEFEASLAPGEYVIVAGQSPFPQCNETNVTVTPNSFLRIEISCDTGIR